RGFAGNAGRNPSSRPLSIRPRRQSLAAVVKASPFIEEWIATQNRLRRLMIVAPLELLPRFVAGADAAFSDDKKTVFAAAVVYDREECKIIEVAHASKPAEFPYVPGFLSFREGPAVEAAIRAL